MTNETFYEGVYKLVAQIPMGKVATYGQIACLLGKPRAARAVGYAMHQVTEGLNLPSHRVVNRTGKLAPDYVFGGQQRQKMMLESEGITFLTDECIDIKKHIWNC